jgi:20S proteasome alpha/beta subunit
LNKYGNSIQLEHAREASERHGRLVVAGLSQEGDVVVVSLYTPRLGIVDDSPYLMHALQNTSHGQKNVCCLMVCTGVKADVTWLVQCLRDYQKRQWERYDDSDDDNISSTTTNVVKAISTALLDFMGYKREAELVDGAGLVVTRRGGDDDNDSDSTGWARPLGVQTLVLRHGSPITLLQPSGVAQSFYAYAMGKGGATARRLLEEQFQSNTLSTGQVKDLLLEIIKDVVSDTAAQKKNRMEVTVEILSRHGKMEQSRIPLESI